MKEYLEQLKEWYTYRELRERLLCLGLCWAFIYAVFSFFIFMPYENQKAEITTNIKLANTQIQEWKVQTEAINKLAQTPLYKEWTSEEKKFNQRKETYQSLLKTTSHIEWAEVIKSILFSDKSITIEQIKNSPEEIYTIPNIKTTIPLYQQKLTLVIHSNFFDTLNYLKKIQQALPTIHWNSLSYEVMTYPKAKVAMEFSVLYEKSKCGVNGVNCPE